MNRLNHTLRKILAVTATLPLLALQAEEAPTPLLSTAVETGSNFTIAFPGDLSLEMIWIPAGTFTMGSPRGEVGRSSSREAPQTEVTLTHGFWIGQTTVTQAVYEAVTGVNPSEFQAGGTQVPVHNVRLNEALAFADQLTERAGDLLPEGYRFTVPSEAQWEYAARAGTTTAYSFGDNVDELGEYAWFNRTSGGHPHPVGLKKANPWGLYDVHGNIWEWTRSRFGPLPGGSVENYEGPDEGNRWTFRGGGWFDADTFQRSAWRHGHTRGMRSRHLGFRVALDFNPPTPDFN